MIIKWVQQWSPFDERLISRRSLVMYLYILNLYFYNIIVIYRDNAFLVSQGKSIKMNLDVLHSIV